MGPSRQRVLSALPGRPGLLTIESVAEQCNISYSTARVHLRELRKAGLAWRVHINRRDFYSREFLNQQERGK